MNNTQITDLSLSPTSGVVFTASLNKGINVIEVAVRNDCGHTSEMIQITFDPKGGVNGNNGHGNNADGVDSSNPGQGNGGPGGTDDPSDGVDDENGNGGGNGNGGNGMIIEDTGGKSARRVEKSS